MRVLLVTANFRPRIGGIERFTEILARGLAESGHNATVVCCRYGGAPLQEELDGVFVERVPASYLLDHLLDLPYPVPAPFRLLRAMQRHVAQADVVHVQDVLYATSPTALMLASKRRIASVLTQHVAFVPQRHVALDTVERAALATIGRCARLATLVATLNPAVAAWAKCQWSLADVRVLPVGIPLSARGGGEDRAWLRRSFGLSPDRFVALFVGRDVAKKGLDVFLQAGDPGYDLVAVTDRTGPAGTATLFPFMSPNRLQRLMECADAFVLPSEGEGLPLSMQEALAAGMPVVTTRQPGYERFVSDDDVVYVDRNPRSVRAALRRLAEDEELQLRLSMRGREAAKRHFGLAQFVTAYEDLYAEACERNASQDDRPQEQRSSRYGRVP
jgi:glycosyltransferase involved in cell wall biosynthesis